jgi:hypothetical protein
MAPVFFIKHSLGMLWSSCKGSTTTFLQDGKFFSKFVIPQDMGSTGKAKAPQHLNREAFLILKHKNH